MVSTRVLPRHIQALLVHDLDHAPYAFGFELRHRNGRQRPVAEKERPILRACELRSLADREGL
jgi:hypothetical protein